jgi:hypothetical protein
MQISTLSVLLILLLLLTGCSNPITNPTDPVRPPAVVTLPDGTTVLAATPVPIPAPALPTRQVFLDNGRVRLGIDLIMGGAITYLAEKGQANMINNHDLGRQIQTSLYAGPSPFKPNGKEPLANHYLSGWNPNQAGNYAIQPSPVVAWQQPDAEHLYVKTAPLFYAYTDAPADCVMETWIELSGNTVNVRFRATAQRSDTTQYYPRPQEAPGIALNAPWSLGVTYNGQQPFTDAPVYSRKYADTEYETIMGTENWVARLDDRTGRGLGLWQENQYRFTLAFFGKSYAGAELDNPMGYMGGAEFAHIEHNGVYEYGYTLIVGSLADIRQFVYARPRPTAAPAYRFVADRQRWYAYFNVRDQGYPVRNELSLSFAGTNNHLVSPFVFWRAAAIPKVYVQAAFTSKAPTARLVWRAFGDPDLLPRPDRAVEFPIVGDGQYRTYEIDLSRATGWQGDINQIGLEASPADPATRLRLRSLTATRP